MAKKIDEIQVRHVGHLARLQLSDEEVAKFTSELSAILEYIDKLNELDTASVEPSAHCLQIHNVFREDNVRPSLDIEDVLANAPAREDEFFKVPKILDDDSGA